MLFTAIIETTFTAAHQLTFTDDSKEPKHSHNWRVEAAIAAEKLDRFGLVCDFNELKAKLERIVAPFEDAELEGLECFQNLNTSAENVAKYIYDAMAAQLPRPTKLEYIMVTEAPFCRAKYSR